MAAINTSRRRHLPRRLGRDAHGAASLTREADLAVYAALYPHTTIAHLRSYKTTGRTQ